MRYDTPIKIAKSKNKSKITKEDPDNRNCGEG